MRSYFGSLLALYGAGVTLLDSPGSFFEVMALSPQSAGSPGSSPGGSSPFSKIAVRNIWLLKDKQAVVEDYEQQEEFSCAQVFRDPRYIIANITIALI